MRLDFFIDRNGSVVKKGDRVVVEGIEATVRSICLDHVNLISDELVDRFGVHRKFKHDEVTGIEEKIPHIEATAFSEELLSNVLKDLKKYEKRVDKEAQRYFLRSEEYRTVRGKQLAVEDLIKEVQLVFDYLKGVNKYINDEADRVLRRLIPSQEVLK